MTDRQRLAELETAYAELVRKQNRLDRAADVDEVTGYALHRLLKKMKLLETEIDELRLGLNNSGSMAAFQLPSDFELGGAGGSMESV